MKTFDITIVEVLLHRARIEAADLVAANALARDMWDEEGPDVFSTETLGRTDLIVCDEATAEVGA